MGICNHHLPVETGTCNNIGKRLRTCEIRIIGGEFCYIMECAHFSNERKNRFFNKRVCKNLNIMKSNELMNTNNVIVWQDYSSLTNVMYSYQLHVYLLFNIYLSIMLPLPGTLVSICTYLLLFGFEWIELKHLMREGWLVSL